MTKEWLKVVVASIFEMVWVSGLAHASTPLEWFFTAIGVVVSFYLLTSSVKHLPIGTVYAVFAGLGSVGSIIVGAVFFNESVSLLKLVFMGTLILGILGLKLIETDTSKGDK
ncbi:DMT family transporter [Vagococcus intermedius]|uniref:SMR family transporter n=1 Tax=Vagococcus intermedius TaxID=2991418 RepID=A0AAF0CTH6_9ENTE|nr:SMR family transporter [Vagococcus intermedius]WEG72670.1 SMR family transporter [Vagococcus intermedius]WEG74755.1 SMR family transporter [Vagococcus intermedius]